MIINTVYNEDGEFMREEPFDADVELDKLYPTELTEQEYIQTCNTEQLAEFLMRKARFFELAQLRLNSVEFVIEWLKGVHKE